MEFTGKNSEASFAKQAQIYLIESGGGLSNAASAPVLLVKRKEISVSLGNLREDQLMPVKKMLKVQEGTEVRVDSEKGAEVKVDSEGGLDGDDCNSDEEPDQIESQAYMMESQAGEKILEVKARQDPVGGKEKADEKIYCKGMDKKTYQKNYQENNKEKRALNGKAWAEKNKERVKKMKKAQYEKNKLNSAEYYQRYREKNRERSAQASKSWYQKNKERVAQLNKATRERKKREKCTTNESIQRQK